LAQMNSELATAQIISAGQVSTDRIGIGTRVAFTHVDTGQRVEMTFLGPWDADHAKGIYNYKAPLSQSLMGKRIGDQVQFEHDAASGTFTIAEIQNALN